MKKHLIYLLTIILIGSFSITFLYAQAPEAFVFQGVAMDSKGKPIEETELTIQVFITQNFPYPKGTRAYEEVHGATTDKYGLFTINVGEGRTVDDFSKIQWARFEHYLCVQVYDDKALTWVDICNTQLLSVPYSLHAKTADSYAETDPIYLASQAANITATDITNLSNLSGVNTGDQDLSSYLTTETDPVFSASQASNITESDITNLDNLSGVNTGDQDLSNVALKSNVLELDNTTPFTPDGYYEPATKRYVDEKSGNLSYAYGFNYDLGGYVFYLSPNGKHGLVAATQDQGNHIRYYEALEAINNLNNYDEAGRQHTDWRLPTKTEAVHMYSMKTEIGGFTLQYYWTSHPAFSYEYEVVVNFLQGNVVGQEKLEYGNVRAVRAF